MGKKAEVSEKMLNTKKLNTTQVQKDKFDSTISSPANNILSLQKIIGNQTVQRLLKSDSIQEKLKMGKPGFNSMQQADGVAASIRQASEPQVQRQSLEEQPETMDGELEEQKCKTTTQYVEGMRQREKKPESMLEKPKVKNVELNPLVTMSKKTMDEHSIEGYEGLSGNERFSDTIQLARLVPVIHQNYRNTFMQRLIDRSQNKKDRVLSGDISKRLADEKGSGQLLEPGIRHEMETTFKQDLSDVHIHTNATADKLSRELGAKAFTSRKDIFFREGTYQPKSKPSKKLLAHELTHVVQQAQNMSSLPDTFVADNDALERQAHNTAESIVSGQGISSSFSHTSMAIQRGNEEEGATSPRQGTFPINFNNRDSPWRVGSYNVYVVLEGVIRWNPFGIQITGTRNGIYIREGDQDRVRLELGPRGFQTLDIDTGAISASIDREGLASVSGEYGPATVEVNLRDRQISMTLDILGLVWPSEMQELVDRVGEITSDFNLIIDFPEGDRRVRLSRIGMDLGMTLGPEQLQSVAEMSIATEYAQSGLATTTAEATVEVRVNLWGIQREITVYESEATAGNIRLFHEDMFIQLALRTAFDQTYIDLPRTRGMSPEQAASFLLTRFNTWYREAYQRVRQRAIDHYTERGFSNATDIYNSDRTPLSIYAGPRVIIDSRLREVIRQVILPHPDPPGEEFVRAIWDNVIHPRETARGR